MYLIHYLGTSGTQIICATHSNVDIAEVDEGNQGFRLVSAELLVSPPSRAT
ncbi:hypothetical protein [Lentzea roselyniae]|uniref:hypothetical protein n=1 Tax=Lentzea roselyniae TaxID=531940 RepID=UPI0031FA44A7